MVPTTTVRANDHPSMSSHGRRTLTFRKTVTYATAPTVSSHGAYRPTSRRIGWARRWWWSPLSVSLWMMALASAIRATAPLREYAVQRSQAQACRGVVGPGVVDADVAADGGEGAVSGLVGDGAVGGST